MLSYDRQKVAAHAIQNLSLGSRDGINIAKGRLEFYAIHLPLVKILKSRFFAWVDDKKNNVLWADDKRNKDLSEHSKSLKQACIDYLQLRIDESSQYVMRPVDPWCEIARKIDNCNRHNPFQKVSDEVRGLLATVEGVLKTVVPDKVSMAMAGEFVLNFNKQKLDSALDILNKYPKSYGQDTIYRLELRELITGLLNSISQYLRNMDKILAQRELEKLSLILANAGQEVKSKLRPLSNLSLKSYRICIHEAGHAVMAYSLGCDPGELSMQDSGDILARTVSRNPKAYSTTTAGEIMAALKEITLIHLGGIAAEYIQDGKPARVKAGGGELDMEEILMLFWRSLAWRVTGQDIINMFFNESIDILEKNWNAVDALAKAFLSDGFIDGDRTVRIIREALEPPPLDLDLTVTINE